MTRYELSYDYSQYCFGSIRCYLRKAKRHTMLFNNKKDAEDTKKHLIELNKRNKDIYCNFCIKEKETRTCTKCNKEMTQGYCIENGDEYYCSDECLHKHYTQEEYLEMFENGDSYWTEWEN